MTFIERLRSLVAPIPAPPVPVSVPTNPVASIPEFSLPVVNQTTTNAAPINALLSEPLPDWLQDEEMLRDEGVLFGLADAQPDEKVAEIRAHFDQQAAPLHRLIEQYAEKINELTSLIDRRETRVSTLHTQLKAVQDWQPAPTDLLRTSVNLILAILVCVGTFYLIDETLQPSYPNHWITAGVFLAGMFNLFGRTSFFYEEGTRLTGRRLVEELALPLAASVFVLSQAAKTRSVWESGALFLFIFFLFLLTGKLLLSSLTLLQNGLSVRELNQQFGIDRQQNVPVWEAERERLEREIEAIRAQKWPVQLALTNTQSHLAQLNTKRDQLVNLFLSEFELAHSIRDRLSEQQREAMFN